MLAREKARTTLFPALILRLSTRTGPIHAVTREHDIQYDEFIYYRTALDFHIGEVAWKKMAGVGNKYDSFYPALAIGPNRGQVSVYSAISWRSAKRRKSWSSWRGTNES